MTSEWAEKAAIRLLDACGGEISGSLADIKTLANALDASRTEGRYEGLKEKQGSPVGWRYKVLVNKHSTGDPLPGEIFMLDIYRIKVWGIPGAWRYSDGPDKPDVDWMCEAEPLFASQEPTA